jgi:hypothetical protein
VNSEIEPAKRAFPEFFLRARRQTPAYKRGVLEKNSQGAHRLSEYFSKSWGVIYE